MKFKKAIRYLFFPKRCAMCGGVIEPGEMLCEECGKRNNTLVLPICYHCGRSRKDCVCKGRKNRFVSAFAAPFYYEGSVEKAIKRLKFDRETDVAPWLGGQMAEFARMVYPEVVFDFVTFVPMTEKEKKERGFNQSELLSDTVGETLSLPVRDVLLKIYETKRQRTLRERQRSGNVLGVFEVPEPSQVKDKRILLCDDLTTSGATLTECAKMLMIHGAREVLCLTAATVPPRPRKGG